MLKHPVAIALEERLNQPIKSISAARWEYPIWRWLSLVRISKGIAIAFQGRHARKRPRSPPLGERRVYGLLERLVAAAHALAVD